MFGFAILVAVESTIVGGSVAAGLDWTQVAIALIASLPGILAAIFARRNGLSLRPPSGGHAGTLIEQTHAVAHAQVALLLSELKKLQAEQDKENTKHND